MILGYASRFLEVNLSTGGFKELAFDDEILKEFIGGRGLATKILWDRLGSRWERIDPLGPENILLFLTGPLTGFFPGGRICVSGKSPQSHGVVGSTVGGELGVELRCAGYDGIIAIGASEKPVYLFIKDSDAEIRNASHIWGKDAKQTVQMLNKECRELLKKRYAGYGEFKEPAKVYIGPAGENKVRTAVVAAKWTHAAGYGGYGAVMGSKNLKAIVVKGSGPLPEVADMKKVKRLIRAVDKNAYGNPIWRRWGTGAGGYSVGAKQSSEPVRNWQDEWHDETSFGVDQFENRVWVKGCWADFGCPTSCLKIAVVKSGPFKGAITDNPDYELQAYLGPNLGLFTPEESVYMASLIDDLGLCGIQTGNVLGLAAELFQRRILTKKDLEGTDLRWGDAKAFGDLAKKIAYRQGIGSILAEGTYRAAVKIGNMKKKDLLRYAITSKGIAIGAHGIRSQKDYPHIISYACGVQGGDHTSTTSLPISGSGSEVWEIFNDSGVYCNFNSFGLARNFRFDFYKAVTGVELTRDDWSKEKAMRVLHMQRTLLLLGGPDLRWNPKIHDDNPSRFYEPLPSGPYKGKAADKKSVQEDVQKYYAEAGWDENGVPTLETLKRFGLQKMNKSLEKMRQLNMCVWKSMLK